jgi:hypothetical protein
VTVEHDEAILRAFILPARRGRYVARLNTRRDKLLSDFHDSRDLDMRYATRVDGLVADEIVRELQARGAPPTCYVMSATSRDGTTSDLGATVEQVFDGYESGTFVSCIPGKLAFYYGEERDDRFILERS